jgi:hypothetical protein
VRLLVGGNSPPGSIVPCKGAPKTKGPARLRGQVAALQRWNSSLRGNVSRVLPQSSVCNAARDRNHPIKPHQINLQRSLIDRTSNRFASVSRLFWVCGRDTGPTVGTLRSISR